MPDLVIQRPTLCLLLGLILTGHSLVTTHILYQIFIKCQQKNVLILCGTKMDIARIMSNWPIAWHWDFHTSYSTSYFANKSLKKYYRGLWGKTPLQLQPIRIIHLHYLWQGGGTHYEQLSHRDFHIWAFETSTSQTSPLDPSFQRQSQSCISAQNIWQRFSHFLTGKAFLYLIIGHIPP